MWRVEPSWYNATLSQPPSRGLGVVYLQGHPIVGTPAAFQAMPKYGSLASGGYYSLRLNIIQL